jgi:hypothetical protein
MNDFIPSSDAELVTFCTNLKTKVTLNGPGLGLTVPEIDAVIAWCNEIIDSIGAYATAKTSYESALSNKKQVVKTKVSSIRGFAKDVKRKAAYTATIGSDLGIVGGTNAFNSATYKSSLKIDLHPGYINLKFVKKGIEGINLYSRKKGELNWEKLGFYAHSPCVDVRPLAIAGQAENREYMCVGIIKDHEIGVQSDIVSVAYAG